MPKNFNIDLETELNIPKHTMPLISLQNKVDKLTSDINHAYKYRKLSGDEHTQYFEKIAQILYEVGDLSLNIFKLKNDLEKLYRTNYSKNPLLGDKLFVNHYQELHKPYNKIKNKCFNLYDMLDMVYEKINKKKPPNWKSVFLLTS